MDERTYTIQELADRTGVSARTIHFYISQGLLQGVGRQGPSTRYPEKHLQTLLFIRELQAQARLSLEEIARVLLRIPPETIAAIARGEDRLSVADLRDMAVHLSALAERPETMSLDLGRAVLSESASRDDEIAPGAMFFAPPAASPQSARSRAGRFLRRRPRESEPSALEPGKESAPESRETELREAGPRETALRESLTALSRLPDLDVGKTSAGEESWVSIHVSDDITLSARGASPEELRILEQIGTTIREILNRARSQADEKEQK